MITVYEVLTADYKHILKVFRTARAAYAYAFKHGMLPVRSAHYSN